MSYVQTLLLLSGLLMRGCAEYAYWHGRTLYGVDCRPAVVQPHDGKCVYSNKGDKHAEKARP